VSRHAFGRWMQPAGIRQGGYPPSPIQVDTEAVARTFPSACFWVDASDLGREISAEIDAAERVESFTFAVVPR
jgi:hypothetical protein